MLDATRHVVTRATLAAAVGVAAAVGLARAGGAPAGLLVGAPAALGLVALALRGPLAELAAALEAQRAEARASEQLLGLILDAAPVAALVVSDTGRIAYCNADARALFFEGRAPDGLNFHTLLAAAPTPLRQALLADGDGLFTIQADGRAESFHLARRTFERGGELHTLLLVENVSRALGEREAEVWRRTVRVIGHEIGNTIAPILSLLGSARALATGPPTLATIFATVSERAQHLRSFLDGYAAVARAPRPRPRAVAWAPLLARLQAMWPEIAVGAAPATLGWFDEAHLEQALINLVKNAVEAGGPIAEVRLGVTADDDGVTIEVVDRGSGLSPDALENALLPFYTTKTSGSGLGLPLCREIVEGHGGWLRLGNRPGGGAAVTCWLPARAEAPAPRARLTLTRG
jgi:signal transduction histidine kinase